MAAFDDFMKLDIRVGGPVLGTYSEGGVVLVTPDKKVQNGDKLG